jgi:hypothetical protein
MAENFAYQQWQKKLTAMKQDLSGINSYVQEGMKGSWQSVGFPNDEYVIKETKEAQILIGLLQDKINYIEENIHKIK